MGRLPEAGRSCTALADPRRMDIEGYRARDDPCILHYPVCGLSWFQAKYRTLGDFPASWLGGKIRLPESFHRDAREACVVGSDSLEALFQREVILSSSDEAERQITCETCIRRLDVATLLDSVPSRSSNASEKKVLEQPLKAKEPVAAAGLPLDGGLQGIERGWILSKSM